MLLFDILGAIFGKLKDFSESEEGQAMRANSAMNRAMKDTIETNREINRMLDELDDD